MSIRYLIVLMSFLLFAVYATAGNTDFRSAVDNANTVDEAVNYIVDALEDQGYEIPLIVDHAAAADSVGLSLRPTQVIFAMPPRFLVPRLLWRGQTAGIDLPLKFLVFKDVDGSIQLRYNATGYLVDRHNLKVMDPLLRRFQAGTEQFGDLDGGLVTVKSHQMVDETLEALTAAISVNPEFRIPLVLEYEGRRHTRQVLIVFGNPNAGTPLMQNTQEAGLDLPQKFLIWEDRRGEVFITHNDPFFVGRRHNVQGQNARLEAIAMALKGFATAAAGTP